MKNWITGFNIYLLAIIMALAVGCQTEAEKAKKADEKKKDKEASTLRFHLEVNADTTGRNGPVRILRQNPVVINVNLEPFLTEGDIDQVALIDVVGVPAIRVQFAFPHGVRLFENVTANNRGQRIAIFSSFGEARWLAAPQITKPLSDGVFTFTPDATREEAERIVRGLNNVIKEVKKKTG